MYNGIKLIEGVSFMEIDDILEQIRQMIIKAKKVYIYNPTNNLIIYS